MGRWTLFQLNRAPQNMPNYPLVAHGITKHVLQLRKSPRLQTIITENIDLAILLARQRALLAPVTCPNTKFIGIKCTFIQRQVASEKLVAHRKTKIFYSVCFLHKNMGHEKQHCQQAAMTWVWKVTLMPSFLCGTSSLSSQLLKSSSLWKSMGSNFSLLRFVKAGLSNTLVGYKDLPSTFRPHQLDIYTTTPSANTKKIICEQLSLSNQEITPCFPNK